MGIFDPAEIHVSGQMWHEIEFLKTACILEPWTNQEAHERLHDFLRLLLTDLLHLLIQVSCPFISRDLTLTIPLIFSMIRALLKDDPIKRHEDDDIISEF